MEERCREWKKLHAETNNGRAEGEKNTEAHTTQGEEKNGVVGRGGEKKASRKSSEATWTREDWSPAGRSLGPRRCSRPRWRGRRETARFLGARRGQRVEWNACPPQKNWHPAGAGSLQQPQRLSRPASLSWQPTGAPETDRTGRAVKAGKRRRTHRHHNCVSVSIATRRRRWRR